MTKTQTLTLPIRRGMRQDARNVRELCRIAHPKLSDERVQGIGSIAGDHLADVTVKGVERRADGHKMDWPWLHTLRVLGQPDQAARAFVYCAPPLDWIISQGRKSGLTEADRIQLSAAMTECMLLATLPQHRGKGYASRLLTDAEDRYRKAGYRVMIVIIDPDHDEVTGWYRDRGYLIGEPSRPGLVQFWGDRMHITGEYGEPDLEPGQRFGAKALAGDVQVTEAKGTVHIGRLLDGSALGVAP